MDSFRSSFRRGPSDDRTHHSDRRRSAQEGHGRQPRAFGHPFPDEHASTELRLLGQALDQLPISAWASTSIRPMPCVHFSARWRASRCSISSKSHHAFEFFEPIIGELLDEYHLFYIYRDPRDVMASFWRVVNHLEWDFGPKFATVGEFMRAPPRGRVVALPKAPGRDHARSLAGPRRGLDPLRRGARGSYRGALRGPKHQFRGDPGRYRRAHRHAVRESDAPRGRRK